MNSNQQWKGPLSLSFGYNDGSYLNTEVSIGSGDQEALEEINKCRLILKSQKKNEGFSIGWSDLSTNEGGAIQFPSIISTNADAKSFLKSLETFIK